MIKTYVLYIGIKHVRSSDIEEYVKRISEKIFPINLPKNSTVIVLPTDSSENRLECIDPKYITDNDLIYKHTTLLTELNMNIKNIIND